MARPRKMTTEQMISVVDSYYIARAEANEKLMKCSLIAAYAVELGYEAAGYDFARNMEVREHIERMKCFAESEAENQMHEKAVTSYKNLDVDGFIRTNREYAQLARALAELDAYWRRIFEHAETITLRNRQLMKEKSDFEAALKEAIAVGERFKLEKADLSAKSNRALAENRYLRKMLRTYLYPAVADAILKSDNEPIQTETELTDAAAHDFIGNSVPKSFEASIAADNRLQSETDRLIEGLWGKCDE